MSGSRVVLVSYAFRPPTRRIINYAHFLLDHGFAVDLIARDEERWRVFEIPLAPEVRLFTVGHIESRLMIRRLENLLVFRVPGNVLRHALQAADSNLVTRPLAPGVSLAQRAHKRLARGFHRRIFLPGYALLRARLMAGATAKALRDVEFIDVDRVVATDVNAITFACRLAQGFPDAAVASRLDRHPYLRPGETDETNVASAV